MANYFSKFPKLDYSYNNFNTFDYVTNIVARFALEKQTKDNTVIYYEYDIREGDTPEIIASKVYGSAERHWIVLSMNDIVDPQYDWPLTTITLNNYIDSKYSSSEYANSTISGDGLIYAQSNIHSYYKVITTTIPNGNKIVNKYQIDSNTYANVSSSTSSLTLQDSAVITIATTKTTKTYYDYEVEENENKRKIKLLKNDFVGILENELERVFLTWV